MKRIRRVVLVFALGLALLPAARALGRTEFPALSGRVVDEADLFSPAEEAELSRALEQFETATTNQFVVATLPSLGGEEIKQFAAELGHHWRLGRKGKDNGALLLVAVEDREVAIQVGYGLEEKLTDGACGEIIREEIIPFFRDGDYYTGVQAGLAAMMARVAPEFRPGFESPPAREGERDLPAGLVVFLVFLFIVLSMMGSTGRSRRYWHRRGFSSGGGFFGGGGFGGRSGGGGFSGGGGGFGGGGASGSW